MRHASKWVFAVAAVLGVRTAAQQFETAATAVVVDVVVRDKGGRQVTNLTLADFELAEDGVAQRVTSLELVGAPASGGARPAPPPTGGTASVVPAPATTGTAPSQPRFTAIVFDRLESESMSIARDGGEAAIANAGPGDVVGVFLIDGGLRMVQGFTSDRAALSKAVGYAVQRAATLITRSADGKRYDGGGTPPSVAGAEFGGGEFNDRGIPNEMSPFGSAVKNSWDMLERQFQGHASTDALLVAGAALSTLPGRKTLFYFTDGIAVPDEVLRPLLDVVATANRGQVTIYAIDTAGLRVGSQDAATRREIMGMGNAGVAVNADGGSSSNLAMMERNEDLLRRSPRVGLTMLARPTGGFLIENTNDLAAGVRRIEEDRRVHYLLTYAPARTELDGKWRTIDVKVKRRAVTVQARQGYVAVQSPGALPVLVFEGPALAAIDRTPAPRDIPVTVGAFAFPRETPPTDADPATDDLAVVVAAPASPLTFETKADAYRTDFTMLALVRDADGHTVHKTSAPYRLTGRASERERMRGGNVRFVRSLPVTPGAYRVAGSVHDTPSGRSGVLTIPTQGYGRGETGLGISSLVILERLERRAAGPAAAGPRDPFTVGDRVIAPYLWSEEHPMERTPDARLAFYFTAVGADAGERLEGQVQVFRTGVPPEPPLFDAPVTFNPADARGHVSGLGQLPLKDLPFGTLELRLTFKRFADKRDVRAAMFPLSAPRPRPPVPPQ